MSGGEISALYDKRDQAADAGTLAHLMVERHINGEDPPDLAAYPEDVAAAAMQGYENYRRWADDNKIQIVEQEMLLISEKHAFGGCPDAIGIDSQGRKCLLDWKTSAALYTDFLCQCAAYRILWNENHPNDLLTGGTHLLRFSKEGGDFHHHFFSDLSEAEEQFLLFRKAFEIDRRLKKRL